MSGRNVIPNPPEVDFREDIPLKSSGNQSINWTLSRHFGGLRFIVLCFAVLSTAITLALVAQIYYGHFELVPHGAVAADSTSCSRIGTDILKAGGSAVDSAIATALCLSVVAPHLTGLDGAGTVMIYNYKDDRDVGPTVIDFSGPRNVTKARPLYPRLISGLAYIHNQYGKLAWASVVRPSAYIARHGFSSSQNLITAIKTHGTAHIYKNLVVHELLTLPALANYLDLIANTSTSVITKNVTGITNSRAERADLGDFFLYAPENARGNELSGVLQHLIRTNFTSGTAKHEAVSLRTVELLREEEISTSSASGTNIAVVGFGDIYVSLVVGMSETFGSHEMASEGYLKDADVTPVLNFLPAIVTETFVCGRRFILGCTEVSTLAQVVGYLVVAREDLISAIELPRLSLLGLNALGVEDKHHQVFSEEITTRLNTLFGTVTSLEEPYSSCNVVQHLGDALTSQSDSRGGGIASRF